MATIDQILRLVTQTDSKGLQDLSKGFDDADSHGTSMAGHVTSALKDVAAITAVAGVAAVAFLGDTVKQAASFEDAMKPLAILSGSSAAEVQQYQQGILDLATKIPISTTDAANAMFMIASAGFKGAGGLQVLTIAAQASASGLGSVNDIASLVTAALTDYKLGADSASTITDKLTVAVTQGRASAADFGPALAKVLPIAAAVGVNFDQVAASIATMTRAGMTADEAGTALRGVLNSLVKPSSGAVTALESIGLSTDDLKDKISKEGLMQTLDDLMTMTGGDVETLGKIIPNIRGLTGVLASAGSQQQAYSDILDAEGDSAGKSAEAFAKAKETFGFNLDLIKGDLNVFMITIGNALLPLITPLIQKVTKGMTSIMDWLFGADPTKTSATGSSTDKDKANATSRFQNLIAVIKPLFSTIAGVISGAMSGVKSIGEWIFGATGDDNKGASRFETVKSAILGPIQDIIATVSDLFSKAKTIAQFLFGDQDTDNLSSEALVVAARIAPIFNNIKAIIGDVGDFVSKTVLPKLQQFGDWFTTNVKATALDGIHGALQWFSDNKQTFFDFFDKLKDFGEWLKTDIAPAALSAAQTAFEWLGDHKEAVVGALAAYAATYLIVAVQAGVAAVAEAAANLPLLLLIASFALMGAGIAELIVHWDDIVKKFPALGEAADSVKKSLGELVDWVTVEFWPRFTAAFDNISKWLQEHWGNGDIQKWLTGPFDMAKAAIEGVFNGIKDIIQIQLDLITGIIQIALDLFSGNWSKAWTDAKDLLGTIWDDIKQLVGDQLKATLGVLDGAWELLTTALMGPWSWFRDNIGGVISSAVNYMVEPLNKAIDAFNALGSGVTKAVNWVTNALGLGGVMGNWEDVGQIKVNISFAPTVQGVGGSYASNGSFSPGKVGVLAKGGGMPDGWAWAGEQGPELIKKQGSQVTVYPASVSATMAAQAGMAIPGYFLGTPDWGDALGDIAGKIKGAGADAISFAKEWAAKGVDKLVETAFGMFGVSAPSLPGVLKDIGPSALKQITEKVVEGIQQIFDKGKPALATSYPGTPAEVEAWILQAIAATGVDPSWLAGLELIANYESTNDPTQVNPEAVSTGEHATGLMQTIPSTFAGYAMAGHGDIFNPVDNAIASIRYILARYGDISNVPGVRSIGAGEAYLPYASGGIINEYIQGVGASGQRYTFGENGPEVVLSPVDGPNVDLAASGSSDPSLPLIAGYTRDTVTRLSDIAAAQSLAASAAAQSALASASAQSALASATAQSSLASSAAQSALASSAAQSALASAAAQAALASATGGVAATNAKVADNTGPTGAIVQANAKVADTVAAAAADAAQSALASSAAQSALASSAAQSALASSAAQSALASATAQSSLASSAAQSALASSAAQSSLASSAAQSALTSAIGDVADNTGSTGAIVQANAKIVDTVASAASSAAQSALASASAQSALASATAQSALASATAQSSLASSAAQSALASAAAQAALASATGDVANNTGPTGAIVQANAKIVDTVASAASSAAQSALASSAAQSSLASSVAQSALASATAQSSLASATAQSALASSAAQDALTSAIGDVSDNTGPTGAIVQANAKIADNTGPKGSIVQVNAKIADNTGSDGAVVQANSKIVDAVASAAADAAQSALASSTAQSSLASSVAQSALATSAATSALATSASQQSEAATAAQSALASSVAQLALATSKTTNGMSQAAVAAAAIATNAGTYNSSSVAATTENTAAVQGLTIAQQNAIQQSTTHNQGVSLGALSGVLDTVLSSPLFSYIGKLGAGGSSQAATMAQAPLRSSGAVMHFANGGLLSEPVHGYGLVSGNLYTFAETAPEYISPAGKAQGGTTITNNFSEGSIIIPAKDLDEMRSVQDFFDKFPQMARARG